MAFARWDSIVQRVLNNLQDLGVRSFNREQVLADLAYVEKNIARDGLALPGTDTITTIIGTTSYAIAAATFRIKRIFRPTDWKREITVITDDKRWEELTAHQFLHTTQPLFVTVWNGNVIFHPAPQDVQTLNLWTYALPTAAAAENTDPTIEALWDDCLILGSTARLSAPKDEATSRGWQLRYEGELAKQSGWKIKGEILSPQIIDHSSTRLGF